MKRRLKKLWHSQGGFTLVEMLVGVGLLTIIMSTIGTSLFQALHTEKEVVDDGLGINELRKGLSWFAEDVKMANSTDLVDGAPAVSSVALSWTDQFNDAGVSHTSNYVLVGDRLVRTYDGNAHTVAHRVVSVAFSFSGRTVTAQVEVNAEPGTTRTLSVQTIMRSTPP